jgi:hypothetical protein
MQYSLDLNAVASRWRAGRHSYRPAQEPIDPTRFAVQPIGDRLARDFVRTHHYSGSYPAAIAAYGLFERRAPFQEDLVGVAVFSVPMQPRAADAYGADGLKFCELGRFVLLDDVGGNGETWFLARAMRQLGLDKTDPAGRAAYSLCLAYSDPVPRTDDNGVVRFAGHYGGIYSSGPGIYLGRGTARTHWLTREGSIVSPRALSKLRTGERGDRATYEHLRSHGAPAIEIGEAPAAYVRRALREGPFRQLRHRGNHAYALPLGSHANRQTVRERMDRGLERPNRTDRLAA